MNNLMDEYIEFTKKNLRKYMKIIFEKYYDNIVIDEYIKTYINARYYNITHSEVVSRAFFKRILNELEYKKEILERKLQKEEIKADERIIDKKVAFISDVGMTGPYLSSLGCDLDSVITRMRGLSSKFLISENSGQFAGVVIEFNDKHQPISIERVLINDDHLYRAS